MATKRSEGTEESKLFDMLSDMAKDSELLERFKNPGLRESVMDEYDLSDEQKRLLTAALDEGEHDLVRYAHVSKLIGDEAEAYLIPFC